MTSEKHPTVTPVRVGKPIRISNEVKISYFCWFLWDAWLALTTGKLLPGFDSVDKLRNHEVAGHHCVFLDQLAPRGPLDYHLIGAALWHVANVAHQLNSWDGGTSLQQTWPQIRDMTIDAFSLSELQEWNQQFGPVTPQPKMGALFSPDAVRGALKSHADNYFDRIHRHVVDEFAGLLSADLGSGST